MSTPILIFRNRLTGLQQAINALQAGQASVTFEGTTYVAAQLPAMYELLKPLGVEVAIEAIQEGAQSWTMDGTTFTRGDLGKLVEMRTMYEIRAAKQLRGGIRTRYARWQG